MKIQQAEELAGISRKNIRFYEEQGLLAPERGANGYREYTLEQVEILRRIKLLRKLGIPLEEIRRLQAGSLTLPKALAQRETAIGQMEKNLSEMRSVCRLMAQATVPLNDLDPSPYLNEMTRLEKGGVEFMDMRMDKRKRRRGPIAAAIVVILVCVAFDWLMVWAQVTDPMPLPLFILLLIGPAACIVGVLVALRARMQEIEKGEQDEAVHY